ncbi:type II secretion system protein [Lachnospiraceae bacterium YH-ros2228]
MRNVNRKLLNNKGFTLAEMLLTVSIIIILGALVAVNVIRYQRKLKLTEMDNAAREIYMAAQNHLSDSVSTGDWGEIYDKYGKMKADDGSATTSTETKTNYLGTYIGDKIAKVDPFVKDDNSSSTETSSTNGKKHEFYYLIVNSKKNLTGNAMAQLLPTGAIDETVRKGAYIIEYDAIQGQVYDVFYTDGDVKLTYENTVTALDDKIKQNSGSNTNRTDSKNLRERFSVSLSSGSKKVALGYYGGASLTDDAFQKNQKVTVEVKNENRLYLIVTVPSSITKKYTIDQNNIKITLKDLRSDASNVQGVLKTEPVKIVNTSDLSQTRYYILDSPVEKGYSITDSSHIEWKVSDNSSSSPSNGNTGNTNEKFHAGDNLRASVTITANKISGSSTNKTKKFKATSERFNSTYAEGSSDTSARITNARHLQNLAISESNQTASSNSTTVVSLNTNPMVSNQITDVKILSDIIWHKGDQPASSQTTDVQAAGQQNANGNKGNQTDAADTKDYFEKLKDEATNEYGFDSNALTVVTTNFTGIQSSTISNVSGSVESTDASKQNQKQNQAPVLSDFMISDPTGYYGLFAKMGADSLSLTNLSLKNFYLTNNVLPDGQIGTNVKEKIDTTTQNWNKQQPIGAGSLIGQFDGKSLNVNKVSIENVTEDFKSNQGIKAGGLIGAITNSSKANITDCYASVSGIAGDNTSGQDQKEIISATNLGGLIGSIDNGAHVLRCYSSGRTVNGGDYDEKHPNISVQNGNVGGLIGNAKGSTSVTYSYSTCSVGANKQNGKTNGSCGGFIGFISRTSSVEGCYSTGLIINLAEETSTDLNNKWADYGQFIGETNSKGGQVKVQNCSVLKGINSDQISVIWDDSMQNTSAYDNDIKIQSSLGQATTGEKNPFVVSEKSTAAPVDKSLGDKYPYCTTRQLSDLFQHNTVNASKDESEIGHVGDWPIEKEPATVGLIYYEYIKKDNNKKPDVYYNGFWENMSKDPNQYHVQPFTKLEGDKFPTDGYVVEDGYALVLKVDHNRDNTIKAPNGTTLSDTNTFIGTESADGKHIQSLSLKDATVNSDGGKIGLNQDDYKLYRIKEPDDNNLNLYQFYENVKTTNTLNVYVENSDETTKTKSKTKYASFYVNLYSANAVVASTKDLPNNSLTIRSARQFYNLFYESVNNTAGLLTSSTYIIKQEMDIDFEQEFTNKFGIRDEPYKNDPHIYQSKFQKLDTTKMTFRCHYNGNQHYLKNWIRKGENGQNQNLFGKECKDRGILENLYFYKVTGQYLFNTNSGSIHDLTFIDCNMNGYVQSGKVDPSVKGLNSQAKSAFPFGQDADATSDQNRNHASNTTSNSSANQTAGQTLNQDDSHSNQAAGNVSNKDSNN